MYHKNQIKFAISICLSISSLAIHAEGYINENMVVFTSSMDPDESPWKVICAELAGDFHLGYARQLTDKSSLLFDLAF